MSDYVNPSSRLAYVNSTLEGLAVIKKQESPGSPAYARLEAQEKELLAEAEQLRLYASTPAPNLYADDLS